VKRLLVLPLLLFLAFLARDLFFPPHCDLRKFDPREVGALEAEEWRAYYDRAQLSLFWKELSLLREQYGFPPLHAAINSFRATRAALRFARAEPRADVLEDLTDYFTDVIALGGLHTDPKQTARKELAWWVAHRERRPANELAAAVSGAAAELYGVKGEALTRYGELRAAAMQLRDEGAAKSRLSEEEWQKIALILTAAYQALHEAVNTRGG
jgi:hypothetical protein